MWADKFVIIVTALCVCGLVEGAVVVAPLKDEPRKWAQSGILLVTAAFFVWRFLL